MLVGALSVPLVGSLHPDLWERLLPTSGIISRDRRNGSAAGIDTRGE
jgi:hypothetical protein